MRIDARSQKQLLVTAVLAIALAVTMPWIYQAIHDFGRNIPSLEYTDKVSDYLKGWAGALFFLVLILIAPLNGEDKRNLKIIWIAKILVTLVFMLMYEANYGLDAYSYFLNSQDRQPDLSRVGFGNGTANMMLLTWWFEHYVIASASYHLQKVICAFIGTIGVYLFYLGLRRFRPNIPSKVFLGLALFPSILFWSSTLGKDALIVFGISLTFYGMLRLLESRNAVYLLPAILGLAVTGAIRLWVVPILGFSFAIVTFFYFQNILFRVALIGGIVVGAVYSVPIIGKQLSIGNIDELAQRTGAISRSWERGGSAGDVPIIRTPVDALKFLPLGMFTALFRPLPGEVMNPFGILAGLENLGLLFLVWRAVRAWRRDYWKDKLIIWLFAYVFLWSVLYAFISPQNLGAAVRFKVQALPQLLFLLIYAGYLKPLCELQPAEAE